MPLKQHLILVGPMGAGKSTIGRLLSESLQSEFSDLDKEIEHRCGATIPWIFDIEGEEGFRDRESHVLKTMLLEPPIVLATGGGCVLRASNRSLLAEKGSVVYLRASVAQQLLRTAKDKNRPLLQTPDPEKTLIEMAERRNPLYDGVADVTIDTNHKNPKQVVSEIIDELNINL